MEDTLNAHLLYEIALNQFAEESVELILSKALPLYQKKLNCFFVAVYDNKEFVRISPDVFKNNEKWLKNSDLLAGKDSNNSNEIIEMFDEDIFYYSYPLTTYGRLIFGRNKPLKQTFKNELKKVTHQLGFNLLSAAEKEIVVSIKRKLQTSEAYLKAVLENTLHSIWSVDTNYRLTYINEVFANAFFQTFGVRLELGSNIIQALPHSIRTLWQDRYDRVFNGERLVLDDQVEVPGFVIYIEVVGNPILQGKKVIGASFFGSDVTKRKQVEEGRKELINRFEQIGTTVPGLIYQFRLRPDGTTHFPYVSNSSARIFGLMPHQVSENSTLAFEVIHKDDLLRVQESIISSARKLTPWQIDFRINHKERDTIWVQGTAKPHREKDGSILWNGYLNDITKRKKAELELLKLSRAIEQNPASVVITNNDGFIEYVNPKFCEVTGYTQQEAVGQKPSILKSGMQTDDTYKNLWKTIKTGQTWRGELHNKKKNGELFWEMASISPISNSDGETTNYLAIKEDISELKKAEELILKNLEEKNVLLSEIHHRVKNNMAIIYSLLGLQTEFSNLNEETRVVIRDLQSRVKSMGIVHELVYQNDNIAKMCITQLVEKVSRNLKSIYQQKDVEIEVIINADEVELDLNKSVPFSLLMNEILTNKWKHAFKGRTSGQIEINLHKNEVNLHISIQDDGWGVKDLNKLQSPESYGYTIIHGLVSQLDGTINFSNIPNGGLKVELEIPLE